MSCLLNCAIPQLSVQSNDESLEESLTVEDLEAALEQFRGSKEQRVRPFTLYNLSDLASLEDGLVPGVIFVFHAGNTGSNPVGTIGARQQVGGESQTAARLVI